MKELHVITCFKAVPDDQSIAVKPNRTLSFDNSSWEAGPYDLIAIEAGARIVANYGGKLTALSAGGKQLENSKLRKSVLSRGPTEACMVVDDTLNSADTYFTASVLADAIRKIGKYDLVICGEGSADLYVQQVGIQLGELLNVATVNSVSKIDVQDDKLVVERNMEDCVEILEVPLPAVISVTADIYEQRIPNMRDILAAGKKPVTRWGLDEVSSASSATEVVSVLAPELTQRKMLLMNADNEEDLARFVDILRKELH